MSDPRCPFCNTSGFDKVKSDKTSDFIIIYCGGCGAIHGVLPLNNPTRSEQITISESKPPLIQTKIEPLKDTSPPIVKANEPKKISKDKIGAIIARGGYMALAYLPPLCPKCNIEMEKFTIPEGHAEAGQQFWKCPNFQNCRQWQREG